MRSPAPSRCRPAIQADRQTASPHPVGNPTQASRRLDPTGPAENSPPTSASATISSTASGAKPASSPTGWSPTWLPTIRISSAKPLILLACISIRRATPPCSAWMKRPPFRRWTVVTACCRCRPAAPNVTALSKTQRHAVALRRTEHADRPSSGQDGCAPHQPRVCRFSRRSRRRRRSRARGAHHLRARGIFTSTTDLACKLSRYINAYSKTAKPFRWKYSDSSRRIFHTVDFSATAHLDDCNQANNTRYTRPTPPFPDCSLYRGLAGSPGARSGHCVVPRAGKMSRQVHPAVFGLKSVGHSYKAAPSAR